MTDPNLPTMQTRINGLALTLAEKTWAQKELTANPDLASTWTPETDVNLTTFIKQSATQSASPAIEDSDLTEAFIQLRATSMETDELDNKILMVPSKILLAKKLTATPKGKLVHREISVTQSAVSSCSNRNQQMPKWM
ncbi:hypothetical protein PROFUN_11409 [Planoprotostelium fungivorum]|uniref:Uncharacterized protein n=1 Tax=Planoprotostelium fungivorum TaxID=1890364 RepID=A0A2P6NA72_9EUKA|nr:hypothetical protein PROFUN_11409 [Planoprotostelium fungivorum]